MTERLPSITSEIEQLHEMKTVISEVLEHCDKMKSDILEYSSDSTQELRKLTESMKQLAEQQKQLAALSNAASQIDELIASENTDVVKLLENFSDILKTCKEEECIDDAAERAILAMDNYIASSQQTVQNGDDDILVTEATESYKDPLTKLIIQDPVKSINCNHSYEKKSILKYLERSRKCPHSGCVSTLSRNDLMDDLELKKKLLRLKQEHFD